MSRHLMIAALLLALLGAAYGRGWADRGAREQARSAALLAERDRAAARVIALAEALRHARSARAALAARLEAAAQEDETAGRMALPARAADRVLQR
ncbi:hypothetical protein [Alkalilacustris brevis]|uniref:hypothetical protein n=1 Tax=Alkalilacustris brevis TaxID=2026338 RepID=UPI000E0CD050|nr:hypothetical protein [Alkalilacustris brevis]